jgi:fused signal recognition particle receptor
VNFLLFIDKIKEGLNKTRKSFTEQVDKVLSAFVKIDEDLFEELEEILITSDLGIETTEKIITGLREKVKQKRITDASAIREILQEEIIEIFAGSEQGLKIGTKPSVIIVVGVNGVGKTTTIGKMAAKLTRNGKKVIIAAADTFRAAAIDQLEIWGKRTGVEVIKHNEGSDPAAVIFDAIKAAKARRTDVLICDTAGRLHNKKNLMEELKKIWRIIEKEYPEANKEVYLALDATTGQNALSQAKLFGEVAKITGMVLTKLDGTAKGGIVIAIKDQMDIPVKLIGVGEKMYDLQEFNPNDFVAALFDEE